MLQRLFRHSAHNDLALVWWNKQRTLVNCKKKVLNKVLPKQAQVKQCSGHLSSILEVTIAC